MRGAGIYCDADRGKSRTGQNARDPSTDADAQRALTLSELDVVTDSEQTALHNLEAHRDCVLRSFVILETGGRGKYGVSILARR